MAVEFIRKLYWQGVSPGSIQANGIQPATVTLGDGSPFFVAVGTDMSDPLAQYAPGTPIWVRFDDTDPGVVIPVIGTSTSESTAPVITATVSQPGPNTAV